jgi:hypothetical protein
MVSAETRSTRTQDTTPRNDKKEDQEETVVEASEEKLNKRNRAKQAQRRTARCPPQSEHKAAPNACPFQ